VGLTVQEAEQLWQMCRSQDSITRPITGKARTAGRRGLANLMEQCGLGEHPGGLRLLMTQNAQLLDLIARFSETEDAETVIHNLTLLLSAEGIIASELLAP